MAKQVTGSSYTRWRARQKQKGAPMRVYCCPHCKGDIETLVPPEGQVYDSMVSCPHCARMHFKVVSAEGEVTTGTGEDAA